MSERVIDSHLVESDVVQEFVRAARDFCDVIDRVAEFDELTLLEQLARVTPAAYALAQSLEWPWHYEGEDDEDDDDKYGRDDPPEPNLPYPTHHEWRKDLCDLIGAKLGEHRGFHFVYDPSHPSKHDVIYGDLADCLADIYEDRKVGLLYYDRGTIDNKAEAVWRWKFGAEDHWGTHVAEVMLPIHHLLNTHYDRDARELWEQPEASCE